MVLALAGGLVLFRATKPQRTRSVPAPGATPPPAPAAPVARTPEPPPAQPTTRTARRTPSRPATVPAPEAPRAGAGTEAAPATGVLHIDSDVAGAQVFLDRVFIGAAPLTVPNVAPGSHRLNVSAPGYDGVAETLDVAAGDRDVLIRLKDVRLDVSTAVVHKHRIGSCRGQLTATPQ